MRYIVLLKSQQLADPPPALFEAIMKLGAEATAAGALIDNAGLAQGAPNARIQLGAGGLSVTDGPFAEAKEFISYAQYEVRSKEEAVEWANRFLRLHRDLWPAWEGDADVLKVMGPEDFGPPA